MNTYDYIVIGAGSAGCVLAYRLSRAGHTVLVLEAGGTDEGVDEIAIPAAYPGLFKTEHDWAYETIEQKQVLGRRMYWPRGRVLGGSSSINAQLYIRGNRLDYDTWASELGCAGWGYDDLLPYFIKAEDNERGASDFHGIGGPLRVEDLRYRHEVCDAFVESAVAAGIKRNADFNGAEQDGVGFFQVTQKRGRRWSTADAYLRPALIENPGRVTVLTGALVTRIVVEGGRAIGVDWQFDGSAQTARVSAEVLLSGGAINSPQLLLLSGIGPAGHLREFGIEVVSGLPGVGQNLQDHLASPVVWLTTGTKSLHDAETLGSLLRWQTTRTGPLTSPIAEACAFIRTSDSLPAPDIQFHVAGAAFVNNGLDEPPGRGFSVGPTLVSVASSGSIRLKSTDPRWHPEIDAGYLSDDQDLEALLTATTLAREIATGGQLSQWLERELWPGSTAVSADSLRDHIRRRAQTLYHPVGTCAMGIGDQSVVDLECKVRGVAGLRVIDASVMPRVPRGNTNAPTIAIAEKAADLILRTR